MSNFNTLINEATDLLNNATTEADFSRVEDMIEDLWDSNPAGSEIKAITDLESLLVDQWQVFKNGATQETASPRVKTATQGADAQETVVEIIEEVIEEDEDDCIPSFTDSIKAVLTAQETALEETVVVLKESAPSIPSIQETAPTQTETPRTISMTIKLTASQRRVISLLLDNPRYNVEGIVDLKGTSMRVDAEAQASLTSLLEEMADFNPRSFAALIEKINSATTMTSAEETAPAIVIPARVITEEEEFTVVENDVMALQEKLVEEEENSSYLGGFATAAKRASWGFKDADTNSIETTSTNPWGAPTRKTTFVSMKNDDTAQPIPTMENIDLDLI